MEIHIPGELAISLPRHRLELEHVQQELLSGFVTALLVIEKQLERAPVFVNRKWINLSRNSHYRTPGSSEEMNYNFMHPLWIHFKNITRSEKSKLQNNTHLYVCSDACITKLPIYKCSQYIVGGCIQM